MKSTKALYDRNNFFEILKNAKSLNFFGEPVNSKFISFGEREPDAKILQAAQLFNLTIIEGFKPNVDRIQNIYPTINIIHSNIEDYVDTEEFKNSEYDICWWYHGPEHLPKHQSIEILKKMKSKCRLVITSMPHGHYHQGAFMNNELECHKASFYVNDFEVFGDDAIVFWETINGDDKTSIDVLIKGDLV